MRIFEAKNLDEVLKIASEDLEVPIDDIIYDVLEEKTGFLRNSIKISVYEAGDYAEYAKKYLKTVIQALGLEPEFRTELDEDVIKIVMSTNHNSILIGKNGKTLLALNEILLVALNAKFKKRIRVLLDINDYKQDRYRKVVSIAKRVAGEVAKTQKDAALEPMPSDERRAVHNALSDYRNVTTESVGNGHERKIVIKYKKNGK